MDSETMGHVVLEDYCEAFDQYAHYSVPYAVATFHLLVGQLPNIKNIRIQKGSNSWLDARIHPCYFSPSGTGKGEGANFVSKVAKDLGLKYQPVTSITDAGLVGTINEDKEIEYGWLHPSKGINIISATEASVILQDYPPRESRNVMDLLQVAMNNLGSDDSIIARKIGFGDPIEFQPTCSFLLTTYVPTNLTNIILQRGLLQRAYLTVNTVSLDDRLKAMKRQIANLTNPPDSRELVKSIVDRLKHVNTHYSGKTYMPVDARAVPLFEHYTKELLDMIYQATPFLQEKLGEFVSRMSGHQTRLAAHFACLSLHDRIEPGDVGLAALHTRQQFKDILSFLERSITVPKEWNDQFYMVKRRVSTAIEILYKSNECAIEEGTGHRWIPKQSLIDAIKNMSSVTDQTASINVQQMKEWRLIEVRKHKVMQKEFVRLLTS